MNLPADFCFRGVLTDVFVWESCWLFRSLCGRVVFGGRRASFSKATFFLTFLALPMRGLTA